MIINKPDIKRLQKNVGTLKTGPTKDRKGLMPPKRTEKNFSAPKKLFAILCYFNTCLRTFNIIVVLISDCIIVFALKCLIKIPQLFLSR